MADAVELGEVTVPSGELVLLDGGYLGLWSGSRAPEEVRPPEIPPSVDFDVIGADATAAARSFDRQSGTTLYDIPQDSAAEFIAGFDAHCLEHGHQASLRAFTRQVPHRERVTRAVAGGDPDFLVSGVPVVAIGGLPRDRPLRVTAMPAGDWGWAYFRILVSDEPVAQRRQLGHLGVDNARLVFADADALDAWIHDEPVDGRADTVFWGRDQDAVAAEFGAARTGTAGDDNYGWLNLPVAEAYEKALALQERKTTEPAVAFAVDFRPHSHHWQIMAGVRASETESATMELGGARIMFAMTSVGDGFFPVGVEVAADGAPVAIEITIQGDDSAD